VHFTDVSLLTIDGLLGVDGVGPASYLTDPDTTFLGELVLTEREPLGTP
jgi:hypothetical protein